MHVYTTYERRKRCAYYLKIRNRLYNDYVLKGPNICSTGPKGIYDLEKKIRNAKERRYRNCLKLHRKLCLTKQLIQFTIHRGYRVVSCLKYLFLDIVHRRCRLTNFWCLAFAIFLQFFACI